MASVQDTHYQKVGDMLTAGKDSIFEPCKILKYHPDRLVVDVFCTTSRQQRDNVILLFPSLFLNTGVINPPVKDSTGLLFWGADKQPFVLPAQYLIPKTKVENNVTYMNASPNQVDEVFDLKNIESGDYMARSFGGSYLFLKNSGDVELSTPKLHKMKLVNNDGSLNIVVEKTKTEIQNFYHYNGQYEPKDKRLDRKFQEQHINIKAGDKIVESNEIIPLNDKDMIKALLSSSPESVVEDPMRVKNPSIWELQMLNVFDDDDEKQKHPVDGKDLFLSSKLFEQVSDNSKPLRSTIEISKKGTMTYEVTEDNKTSKVTVSSNFISVDSGGTKVNVRNGSDIDFSLQGKTYTLSQIINRINTLSALHDIPGL